MKKISAFITALILTAALSGCGLPFNSVEPSDDGVITVKERDSTVTLDIYPENDKYELTDKFQRAEYRQLTKQQKSLYIILDNAVYNMTTGYIKLGVTSKLDVEVAYHALRNDRPEYFWLPTSYTLRSSGDSYEICFAERADRWLYTAVDRRKYEAEIRKSLSEFLNTLDSDASEFDREVAAHDMLADSIDYDHAALESPKEHLGAWNIVGAFCDGTAVCEGYSRAMQIMCFMMGIDCAVVTGVTTEPHMWNLVKINGSWYHLDLTSNDGDNGVYHFFLNVTTDYMLKGRTIDPLFGENSTDIRRCNTFLPLCTATEYNYHFVNSLYIADKSQTESTVVSLICDAVRGGRRTVEFGVSPDIGFVFGEQNAAEVFKLERCISAANAELPYSQRLKAYSYGGVVGASGFVLSW